MTCFFILSESPSFTAVRCSDRVVRNHAGLVAGLDFLARIATAGYCYRCRCLRGNRGENG